MVFEKTITPDSTFREVTGMTNEVDDLARDIKDRIIKNAQEVITSFESVRIIVTVNIKEEYL